MDKQLKSFYLNLKTLFCPWKVLEFCLCKVAQTMLRTGLVTIIIHKEIFHLLLNFHFICWVQCRTWNSSLYHESPLILWAAPADNLHPQFGSSSFGKKKCTTNFELPIKFYYWRNKDKQLLLRFQNIDTRWLLQAFVSIKSLDRTLHLLYLYLECLLCLL